MPDRSPTDPVARIRTSTNAVAIPGPISLSPSDSAIPTRSRGVCAKYTCGYTNRYVCQNLRNIFQTAGYDYSRRILRCWCGREEYLRVDPRYRTQFQW